MTVKQIATYLHARGKHVCRAISLAPCHNQHVCRAISLAPCHNQHATYTAIIHSSRPADKLNAATGETTHVLFYNTLQRMAAQRATCRAPWIDKFKQHDKLLNLEFESFHRQEICSWDTGKLTKFMAVTENRQPNSWPSGRYVDNQTLLYLH